jgi:hypothetical protein
MVAGPGCADPGPLGRKNRCSLRYMRYGRAASSSGRVVTMACGGQVRPFADQ